MEKSAYHDHLTRLREKFPGQETINLKDAASYCGIDYRTLQAEKSFPVKRLGARLYIVPIINLARWLASI